MAESTGNSCILIGYPSVPCPLGISHVGPAIKSSVFGHVIDPLLTTFAPSRWLNIVLVLFRVFTDHIQPSWPHAWSITHIYFISMKFQLNEKTCFYESSYLSCIRVSRQKSTFLLILISFFYTCPGADKSYISFSKIACNAIVGSGVPLVSNNKISATYSNASSDYCYWFQIQTGTSTARIQFFEELWKILLLCLRIY